MGELVGISEVPFEWERITWDPDHVGTVAVGVIEIYYQLLASVQAYGWVREAAGGLAAKDEIYNVARSTNAAYELEGPGYNLIFSGPNQVVTADPQSSKIVVKALEPRLDFRITQRHPSDRELLTHINLRATRQATSDFNLQAEGMPSSLIFPREAYAKKVDVIKAPNLPLIG